MTNAPQLSSRIEDGVELGMLVWRLPEGWRAISSAPVGGGLGACSGILNAQVAAGYARTDLEAHASDLALAAGIVGPCATLLTAAEVADATWAIDTPPGAVSAVPDLRSPVPTVRVDVTVGLRVPTWAAAPPSGEDSEWHPGTINVVAQVPVPLSDAALVNAVATATEAKTQALIEAGVPGTGTASDSVVIACPAATSGSQAEPFGGPRSPWGAAIARAVHLAVRDGIPTSAERIVSHGPGEAAQRRWDR